MSNRKRGRDQSTPFQPPKKVHNKETTSTAQQPKAAVFCMAREGGIYYITNRGRVLSTAYPVKHPIRGKQRLKLGPVTGCRSIASSLKYTYILQHNGDYFKVKCKKFENQSTGGLIRNARNIACDYNDHVYITDGATRSIFVYGNNRLIGRVMLLPTHDPLCFAITPTDGLIFVCTGSRMIHVYEKGGDWSHTIQAPEEVISISVSDQMLICSTSVGRVYIADALGIGPYQLVGTFSNPSVFSSQTKVGVTTFCNGTPPCIITGDWSESKIQ
jgi:hypothetical protein